MAIAFDIKWKQKSVLLQATHTFSSLGVNILNVKKKLSQVNCITICLEFFEQQIGT